MSDWKEALERACKKTSQVAVSKQLGCSPAKISLVLKGTYNGDLKRIENSVRGEFMGQTVKCPILNAISTHMCFENRNKQFQPTNNLSVKLYRACQRCSNNQ